MTNTDELNKLRSAIVNYRVKCDVAYSELKEEIYTEKDYHKAIEWELNKVIDLANSYCHKQVIAAFDLLPDMIKDITVSGVAVPRQEMDKISLQDLRLVLAELRKTLC